MLKVNGEEVDDRLLREEAASLRPKYYETMGGGDPIALEMQLREWSRENVIERVLLNQEASRQSVSLEDLLVHIASKVARPKPKEVSAVYAKARETLWVPETVHAACLTRTVDETHAEADALAAIQIAAAELAAGVEFAAVADAHSDFPGNGGDMGWIPRGHSAGEFESVVFGLGVGQTGPVFRTPFGFHIARVLGRRPEGIPALTDIREQLEAQILSVRRQQALEEFVDRLRAAAAIEL